MTVVVSRLARSTRKAKGAGHLRRAEILEAAERIFVREGYQGATIRKIAEEVGVSSTALYMHFRDKGEILVEICEHAFVQLIAQNDEIAALPLEPLARVRRMLDAYIQFGLDNPNAYQVVFGRRPQLLSEEKEAAVRAVGLRCYERFANAVREIACEGRLRSADVDETSQTLWAAGHGLVALMINHPKFDWAPADRLKELMLDTLFAGIVTP